MNEAFNQFHQLHLLLVGDSEQDYAYLKDLLVRECEGHLLLDHAHSSKEATTFIEKTSYDLLLCDYQAEESEALELLREMRKQAPGTPVIFLSDHINEEAVKRAVDAGTCGCVQIATLGEASITRAIRDGIGMYCKERQRRKTEEMLRKFWRAVEQTAEMIVITSRTGAIEYVNPVFETMTGYSRDEVMGKSLSILQSEQQGFELSQNVWQRVFAGNPFRGIVVNRKKNGETFAAEKTVTPLRDGDGQITNFVSCDRDITERRNLEAQLQQSQKMDAIGRLAGGVAHDFNNLLMVIGAYAELMQDSLAVEHPLRRNVVEILTASRRAADLTRQLLAFGRKQVQALQVLDLNYVIQQIGRMLPRLIGEDIQLEFLPGENLGSIRADPVQIEQVVMNLAANARDAMPKGGKLTVETAAVTADDMYIQNHSMVPKGDYVLLAVTDTGQGIPKEHLPHIFEPFYTTKEEGHGTGLGLATVYGIVKQSGGFVWVYSEVGQGTTFKIYLPRVAQSEFRARTIRIDERASLTGWETVLLVEDETPVRKSEQEFLVRCGYNVLEAENGEDAVRVAREFSGPIQLMITDVVMPKMSGARLAAELATPRPEMKVLFVSGYAEKTVLRHGQIDVAAHFLQKPFSLKALSRKIRELLKDEVAPETTGALVY